MSDIQLQEYLFQRIREKLPTNASLSEVVSELLNVSNDSAYRRIRGETPLIIDETRILCQYFKISIDQLLNIDKKSVIFTPVLLDATENNFENYLTGILKGLKHIASFEEKDVIYLAKDMVLFHNFYFKPLFAFRYFFWMKSIVQDPDFGNRKFKLDCLPPHIEKLGKEITSVYNSFHSTEIWNTVCINSSVAQIEYYREAGFFNSDKDSYLVYEALRDTIEHLRIQAEYGCKFLPGETPAYKKNNFDLYYNRLVLGDNTILAITNQKKTLYLAYDTLNYMMTQDESFCNSAYEMIQGLLKKATILSNVSEKQRNIFFNILLKKIPGKEKTINA